MPFESELWTFAAFFLIFWVSVHLLDGILDLEKHGIKVVAVFIRFESQGFKAFLDKASQRNRRLWRVFSNLSLVTGAGMLFYAVYFLSQNLLTFAQPSGEGSPVVPVLPGVTIRLFWLPYFILGFLVAVVTHEMAHGVIARIEGVDIKSAGLFFALVQPGGFVEPDENELQNSSTTSKMKILSAGSSMNLLVGLLVSLIISSLFISGPAGIVILEVLGNGPLARAGLQRWEVIYAINGTQIGNLSSLGDYMADVEVGDELVLSTSRGDVSMTAGADPDEPDRPILGIVSSLPYCPSRISLGFFWDIQLYVALNWTFLVLVNIAVLNMLPIPFFDGDRFLQYFLQRFVERHDQAKMLFNMLSLFLLAANMTLTMSFGFFSV